MTRIQLVRRINSLREFYLRSILSEASMRAKSLVYMCVRNVGLAEKSVYLGSIGKSTRSTLVCFLKGRATLSVHTTHDFRLLG